MTFDAFILRHVVRNAAATNCVDSGVGFFHGKAVEDGAYACIGEAVRATFGGHRRKIERGTDSGFADMSVVGSRL
jgi:hypothetical protein